LTKRNRTTNNGKNKKERDFHGDKYLCGKYIHFALSI